MWNTLICTAIQYHFYGVIWPPPLWCCSLNMFLNIFNADQLELCMHVNIHKTQKVDLKCKNSSLAIDFNFIKEIRKLYKGKYPIRSILLSFFNGKSNQWNVLTRLLEFSHFRSTFWVLLMSTCIHSSNWSATNIFKNMCKEQHPIKHWQIPVSGNIVKLWLYNKSLWNKY